MKRIKSGVPAVLVALLVASASLSVAADEVLAEAADSTAGAALGATTGVMLGGAAGGPLGALAGAGMGWLLGKTAQQASGLEERAYTVRTAEGETRMVRSPNAQFSVGEQVKRRGNRLYALER